ncbi:hypothetical protein I601_1577 [Nocardioides dokdonensis FR1436]|uniref:Bacterial Ig-like domain-containing protein n=1 Tax=Nocardioides dokdonensis FR1436 TaxID=1300347 RepID=A0A1A9GK06_9ACTN|nr:Ig-like domain repeat protein [Nocardioides dokdonensis]ANH38010.1 hypothetical protein I601_1577 [Nocardioides dokdonensis FR1436]
MTRARRALTTGLGAAVSTTVATTLIASGTGLASATAAEPAPGPAATAERGVLDLLKILDPAAILGALDGTAAPGDLLGLQRPRWDNPLGLLTVTESVQWLRDGVAVTGATGDSYLPTPDDVGKNLQAVVTGTVLGLVPVPSITGVVRILAPSTGGGGTTGDLTGTPPQLSGIPGVGSLLQILDPVWSLPGVSTSYQWFSDDVAIPGATGQTFVPGLAQAGTTIHARVTGLLAGLPLISLLTDYLPIPAAPEQKLGATSQPAVSGTAKVGGTVTVSDPQWNTDAVQHAYQWLRDGTPISGATTAAYLLTPADLGRAITATVTGTKKGFTRATVDTEPVTPAVGDAIVASVQPRLTGTPALGQTLTASPGTWGTGETPTFGYQWLRDGTVLSGVTGATYAVTAADLGRALAMRVTATRTAYAPGVFTTSAVTVPKAATSTTAKARKKKVRQGKAAVLKIVVDAGSVSPDGTVTVTEGARTLATVAVPKGRRTIRLKKLRPGKHTFLVGYAGSQTTATSTAKPVRVTVLKKKKRR